jgi:hypothetical protein
MKSKHTWRRLRLFIAVSVAAVAVVASAAVVSQADRKKTYDVDATALVATVKSLSGGKTIAAGYTRGDPYGKGAVILKNTTTGNPDGSAATSGKFTLFNKRGSVSGTAEGKLTLTPGGNGNATFEGTGEATSGSGKYKGATGDFDITGTYDAGTGVLTLHATGKVKY